MFLRQRSLKGERVSLYYPLHRPLTNSIGHTFTSETDSFSSSQTYNPGNFHLLFATVVLNLIFSLSISAKKSTHYHVDIILSSLVGWWPKIIYPIGNNIIFVLGTISHIFVIIINIVIIVIISSISSVSQGAKTARKMANTRVLSVRIDDIGTAEKPIISHQNTNFALFSPVAAGESFVGYRWSPFELCGSCWLPKSGIQSAGSGIQRKYPWNGNPHKIYSLFTNWRRNACHRELASVNICVCFS